MHPRPMLPFTTACRRLGELLDPPCPEHVVVGMVMRRVAAACKRTHRPHDPLDALNGLARERGHGTWISRYHLCYTRKPNGGSPYIPRGPL